MRGLIKQPPSSLAFSPARLGPRSSPRNLAPFFHPCGGRLVCLGSGRLSTLSFTVSPPVSFTPCATTCTHASKQPRRHFHHPFSLLVNYMSLIVRYPLHRTATFSLLFFPPSFLRILLSSAEWDLQYVPLNRLERSNERSDNFSLELGSSTKLNSRTEIRELKKKERERKRDWKKNFLSSFFFA